MNVCIARKIFAKPQNPLMSELSKERFAINEESLSKTGIDYFGPKDVKTSKRTWSTQGNSKIYKILFTWLQRDSKPQPLSS